MRRNSHAMPHPNASSRRRQRGAATLFMSIVLLAVMTVVTLYTSRTALMELKVTSNAYRAKQAAEAAEAALHMGIAYFLNGGSDHNGDSTVDPIIDTNADGIGDAHTSAISGRDIEVRFCEPTSAALPIACATPTNIGNVLIYAIGYSDDRSAVHRVAQMVTQADILAINPKAPLTAKSATSAALQGNLTIINNNENLTIWTGTNIATTTGSFETKITIDGNANQISSKKGGSSFYLGPDVVYNDYNLANLTEDDYERNFFGRTVPELIPFSDVRVNAGDGQTIPSNVDGKLVSVYNVPTGSTITINSNLGTEANPVILVVDGDVRFTGSPTIYGVIYAKSLDAAGGGLVHGAIYANTINGGAGNFTINFNATALNNAAKIKGRAAVGNSWRDW